MKFTAAALVAVSLLTAGCSGCSTTPLASGSNAVVVAKAEYSAEEAYNIAAHAYLDADAAGLLTPEKKATAKNLMAKAYDALTAARKAKALGNAADYASQAQLGISLSGQVSALLKPAGN